MKKPVLFLFILMLSTLIFASGNSDKDAVTVTIWHSNSGTAEKAFNTLVDEFNSTHDDIVINAIYQGRANDVLTSVNAATLAGSGLPDIAQLDATAGLDMMYNENLVTVEEMGIDTSLIIESAYAAYSSSIGHLGVPFNASSLLFYYNADLFEKAGVEVPKTLDEFAEIAPIIKEKTGVYAFAGVPTTYELVTFLGSQNGGEYITDNRNGHDGVSNKVLFDENGSFKNFLEKWKTLYDTGAVNNLTSSVSSAFYQGQTASMLASSSSLTTVLENTEGLFNVGVAFVPMTDEGATGGVNIGGGFLASFTNNEEVKEVLEFFISKEAQETWASSTGYMPINKESVDSEYWTTFISENPLYNVALRQALQSSDKVIGLWIPSAYQVYYSFQSTIASVLNGEITIDQAVNNMAGMINANLDEYRRQHV